MIFLRLALAGALLAVLGVQSVDELPTASYKPSTKPRKPRKPALKDPFQFEQQQQGIAVSTPTSPPCLCGAFTFPVCGIDGVTYSNSCWAECAGLQRGDWIKGECGRKLKVTTVEGPCGHISHCMHVGDPANFDQRRKQTCGWCLMGENPNQGTGYACLWSEASACGPSKPCKGTWISEASQCPGQEATIDPPLSGAMNTTSTKSPTPVEPEDLRNETTSTAVHPCTPLTNRTEHAGVPDEGCSSNVTINSRPEAPVGGEDGRRGRDEDRPCGSSYLAGNGGSGAACGGEQSGATEKPPNSGNGCESFSPTTEGSGSKILAACLHVCGLLDAASGAAEAVCTEGGAARPSACELYCLSAAPEAAAEAPPRHPCPCDCASDGMVMTTEKQLVQVGNSSMCAAVQGQQGLWCHTLGPCVARNAIRMPGQSGTSDTMTLMPCHSGLNTPSKFSDATLMDSTNTSSPTKNYPRKVMGSP